MLLLRTCDLCKYQPIKILAILKIEQAVRWHRENSSEARAPRTRRLMQTARLEDHRSTNQGLGLANSPSERRCLFFVEASHGPTHRGRGSSAASRTPVRPVETLGKFLCWGGSIVAMEARGLYFRQMCQILSKRRWPS
jgi:hypothetical protein